MKVYKRFTTMAMATAMVAGNMLTAAASEGTATGTGDYEGYVEETSVFSVDVPTSAANTFNFFVDPNGLLAATEYARISGASANDFETGATLFFTRTPDASASPAVVKYGKDSEKVTLTNKSSYDVNVEVSATVTGADGITLGEVAADATDPTIDLAIVSGSDKASITTAGGKLTGTIAGEASNFKIKWNATDSRYEYGLVDTPDETKWKKYSFNLTGACGGTWTAEQADVQPTVNLTWKVTDPKATAAPSAPSTATYSKASGAEITVSLGGGDLAATGVASIQAKNGENDALYDATNASYADGKITITSSQWPAAPVGSKRWVVVTFNDTANTQKTIEVTVAD